MACEKIQKYLLHYAEQETASLEKIQAVFTEASFTAAVAIPAYNECPNFIERWINHPEAMHHLFITVVNAPEVQQDPSGENHLLWRFIEAHFKLVASESNVYYFERDGLRLLAIDRFSSQCIPPKQGVGLARKIACDLSTYLYHRGKQNTPWIFSSDADAHLPANYFSCIHNQHPATAALVFNFTHIQAGANEDIFAATQRYEQSLKYFQQQLSNANSPYAFYTLGSTLAIHAAAYAGVRGFPKRAGGEDFYLLNKLAKNGRIIECPHITVEIEARASQRVPFGTGPAVQKILDQTQQAVEYHYYAPAIFAELKQWLALGPALWQHRNTAQAIPWPSPHCEQTLKRLQFFDFMQHAKKQCKSEAVFSKAFHHWFDGFRTLKFIHDMQQHYYPAQPLTHCLQYHHKNTLHAANE